MAKSRDYKAEYARRIANGLSKGLSRSQARGHPRPTETHIKPSLQAIQYNKLLELGLKELRHGRSLTGAARSIGVSRERLSHYLGRNGIIEKQINRWRIKQDNRIREVIIYTQGQVKRIQVQGYENAAVIGRYLAAVGHFLKTNDAGHLEPFKDISVSDIKGKTHPLEIRPNMLYRLDQVGGESFEQVYRIII